MCRGLTTSTKMERPAVIRFRLLREDESLVVESISDSNAHNHEVSERVAAYYPENRKIAEKEKEVVSQLLEIRAAPRVIAATLNTSRRLENKPGMSKPLYILKKTYEKINENKQNYKNYLHYF